MFVQAMELNTSDQHLRESTTSGVTFLVHYLVRTTLSQIPTLSPHTNTQPRGSWMKIPFEVPGGSKDVETARLAATKSLGQVPTAHTCDNVLELPNYWTFLMRHDGRDEKTQLSAVPKGDVSWVISTEGLNALHGSRPTFYTLEVFRGSQYPEWY